MSVFIASNGVEVAPCDNGDLMFDRARHLPDENVAAREFFQWERDQELGRWRDPKNQDVVAYPRDNNRALIFNEATGGSTLTGTDHLRKCRSDESELCRSARRYFDVHPEKKPWHDAAAGEVWVITVDGEELLCRSNSDGDFTPVFGHHHWATISNGSRAITAGRRIWPEGGNK